MEQLSLFTKEEMYDPRVPIRDMPIETLEKEIREAYFPFSKIINYNRELVFPLIEKEDLIKWFIKYHELRNLPEPRFLDNSLYILGRKYTCAVDYMKPRVEMYLRILSRNICININGFYNPELDVHPFSTPKGFMQMLYRYQKVKELLSVNSKPKVSR